MNGVFAFLKGALSDGLSNNASIRRLNLGWYGFLGGLAIFFGLGFATALLWGFEPAIRLALFKETLDWVYWIFATGIGVGATAYGVTKVAETKAKGDSKYVGKDSA